MSENEIVEEINLPEETLKKWQNIVDIIAKIVGVPAALIMRVVESDIEVFVSSRSQGNPYKPGDHEHLLGSGLYCETVLNRGSKLLVPNALMDEEWKNNPDIKFNMVSYLGYPIYLPNGKPFGTICILDDRENAYSEVYDDLIKNFREVLQHQLELLYMNSVLGEKNAKLSDYISEIKTLRGIIPICAGCKKIRDDAGFWTQVEKYIEDHSDARFSHGLCGECYEKLYSDQPWYREKKDIL